MRRGLQLLPGLCFLPTAIRYFSIGITFIVLASTVAVEEAARREDKSTAEDAFQTYESSPLRKEGSAHLPYVGRHSRLHSIIDDAGANVKLCAGRPPAYPFITGDHLTDDGQSRVTVFDAEILRNIGSGSSDVANGVPPLLNILAFGETEESIHYSQFEQWGAGYSSSMTKDMRLRCRYYADTDSVPQRLRIGVLYEVDAVVVTPSDWAPHFVHIRCPLPDFTRESKGGDVSRNLVNHWVLRSPSFQVQLVLEDPSKGALHLDALPLCREDGPLHRQEEGAARAGPHLNPYQPVEYNSQFEETQDDGKDSLQVAERSSLSLSVCVRPYHGHPLFTFRSHAQGAKKLVEFIDYHLLIGIRRIYFFDRYGTESYPILVPYMEVGTVIHVPFPQWSEVFYRPKQFKGNANDPYTFPLIYDQVISNEACLMQGRRNGDDWMFFIDTDEFLSYPQKVVGYLPHVIATMEERHRAEHGNAEMASIEMMRYSFFGANGSADPVLIRSTQRCKSFIRRIRKNEDGSLTFLDRNRGKQAARPRSFVGGLVAVHDIIGKPPENMHAAPTADLKIHHYVSSAPDQFKDKIGEICDPDKVDEEPVILSDSSLCWAARRLEICSRPSACDRYKDGECGNLCLVSG